MTNGPSRPESTSNVSRANAASEIYADDQFPRKLAWACMAVTFCFLPDGRISIQSRRVCGVKPGKSTDGVCARRLPVE